MSVVSRIFWLSNFRTDWELQQRCAKFSLTSTWSTSPQVLSKRGARMHVFSDSQRESHESQSCTSGHLPIFHFPGIPWHSLMYFNIFQQYPSIRSPMPSLQQSAMTAPLMERGDPSKVSATTARPRTTWHTWHTAMSGVGEPNRDPIYIYI